MHVIQIDWFSLIGIHFVFRALQIFNIHTRIQEFLNHIIKINLIDIIVNNESTIVYIRYTERMLYN